MAEYKVSADCIGCGMCIETAPDFFQMSDAGVAEVVKQPETEEDITKCDEALDNCPVQAISK